MLILKLSASDMDAEQNRQALDRMICDRLSKDQYMERRLQSLEDQLRLQSNASICDRASVHSSDTDHSDDVTIIRETMVLL